MRLAYHLLLVAGATLNLTLIVTGCSKDAPLPKQNLPRPDPVASKPSMKRSTSHDPKVAPSRARDGRLRLASWNIEWLNARENFGNVKRSSTDFQHLRQYATEIDADVISVQEVDGEAAAQRVFSSSDYRYFIPDQSGAQDVGFVVRRSLQVDINPPLASLDVGGVRAGVDVTIHLGNQSWRLLAVHLKSGCFQGELARSPACRKLALQIPALESWIDARTLEGTPFAVIGDFNRRFFGQEGEVVWMDLNDGNPRDLELWSPTQDQISMCHGGAQPIFIDHIVLGGGLRRQVLPQSFKQHLYSAFGKESAQLSDHCAISLDFTASGHMLAEPSSRPSAPPPLGSSDPPERPGPSKGEPLIKGNISSDRRRLYHLPHCSGYKATKIDEAKGERWFTSEEEAIAAGWTRAGQCRPED